MSACEAKVAWDGPFSSPIDPRSSSRTSPLILSRRLSRSASKCDSLLLRLACFPSTDRCIRIDSGKLPACFPQACHATPASPSSFCALHNSFVLFGDSSRDVIHSGWNSLSGKWFGATLEVMSPCLRLGRLRCVINGSLVNWVKRSCLPRVFFSMISSENSWLNYSESVLTEAEKAWRPPECSIFRFLFLV